MTKFFSSFMVFGTLLLANNAVSEKDYDKALQLYRQAKSIQHLADYESVDLKNWDRREGLFSQAKALFKNLLGYKNATYYYARLLQRESKMVLLVDQGKTLEDMKATHKTLQKKARRLFKKLVSDDHPGAMFQYSRCQRGEKKEALLKRLYEMGHRGGSYMYAMVTKNSHPAQYQKILGQLIDAGHVPSKVTYLQDFSDDGVHDFVDISQDLVSLHHPEIMLDDFGLDFHDAVDRGLFFKALMKYIDMGIPHEKHASMMKNFFLCLDKEKKSKKSDILFDYELKLECLSQRKLLWAMEDMVYYRFRQEDILSFTLKTREYRIAERLARLGIPRPLFVFGQSFYECSFMEKGLTSDYDYKKALSIFEYLSSDNIAYKPAQSCYALELYRGKGLERNPKRAREIFERLNNANALNDCCVDLLFYVGIEKCDIAASEQEYEEHPEGIELLKRFLDNKNSRGTEEDKRHLSLAKSYVGEIALSSRP